MHVLEAGERGQPAVLLLHGFPELAYSWRKVMPALGAAGFHVVAPDQRGYGETTGWDGRYDANLDSFRMLNLVEDAAQLLRRLEIERVHVVGHNFGSPVAAYCAMTRPELFRSVVLMSAPFGGQPIGARDPQMHDELARRGRKHYQWYYSTPEADRDMRECTQGLHAFLRAYYHYKSGDWSGNKPFCLERWSAAELEKLPTYYVMELDKTMAQTVVGYLPPQASAWLTEEELGIYADAFKRTGFQGGLQWYRCATSAEHSAALRAATRDRTIDVPATFIAGAADWGVYQKPGEFERMQDRACTDFRGCHLVPGAGHWVQQERPERTTELLLDFLREVRGRSPN
jgi:pimeloyl-ACP methyl ester carboxylesterase